MDNPSFEYFSRRYLLDEGAIEVECLWELIVPEKLTSKQKEDDSLKNS